MARDKVVVAARTNGFQGFFLGALICRQCVGAPPSIRNAKLEESASDEVGGHGRVGRHHHAGLHFALVFIRFFTRIPSGAQDVMFPAWIS